MISITEFKVVFICPDHNEKYHQRKVHMENMLKKIGFTRIEHYKSSTENYPDCLSKATIDILENNLDSPILIVEDDILFLNPELFKNQLNKFLKNHSDFDVVLIGGNNVPPYQKIDDSCVKVYRCQTTTGYIVQKHYYDTLISNIKEGIHKLINNPEQHVLYAIDKYWFQLQEKDNWYLITPLTVTQREDYSDIEKRHTNYTRVMIDLDKEWMFKARPIVTNNTGHLKQMFMK